MVKSTDFYILCVPKHFSSRDMRMVYSVVSGTFSIPIIVVRNTREDWKLITARKIGRRKLLKMLKKAYLDNEKEEGLDEKEQESEV